MAMVSAEYAVKTARGRGKHDIDGHTQESYRWYNRLAPDARPPSTPTLVLSLPTYSEHPYHVLGVVSSPGRLLSPERLGLEL